MKLNLNSKLVKSIKDSATILFQLEPHIQDNPFRFILYTLCLARMFACYKGNSMCFIGLENSWECQSILERLAMPFK